MAFDVVDADDGFARSEGDGFGEVDADQQGTDQAWALRDGDAIKFRVSHSGCFQSFINDARDLFQMFARSQFGDYAAVFFVSGYLRIDDVGQDSRAVSNHGGGGFIA